MGSAQWLSSKEPGVEGEEASTVTVARPDGQTSTQMVGASTRVAGRVGGLWCHGMDAALTSVVLLQTAQPRSSQEPIRPSQLRDSTDRLTCPQLPRSSKTEKIPGPVTAGRSLRGRDQYMSYGVLGWGSWDGRRV